MVELSELILAMTPSELQAFSEQLPPSDAQLLQRVMAEHHAAGWRADPASMRHHLDPTYQLRPYIQFLSRKWVELCTVPGSRQIWNLPGRYGKTDLVRSGLVWLLDLRPASDSIYVTHGQQLANETGVAVRDLLNAHDGVLRTKLRADRRERKRFVTMEGGGLLAAGLGALPFGFGVGKGGVLVIDDPFKSWAEAHSESKRKNVVDQYKGTARNRLDDESCGIAIIHHRLHLEDLSGHLLAEWLRGEGEEWDHVVLPSMAVEPPPEGQTKHGYPDPLGREPGEPLDPERVPVPDVLRRRKAVGSYLASALEDQNPLPEEGGEIRRSWFHIVDAGELPAAYDQTLTSWDLKLKDRERGDWVVGQAWGRTGADYWLRGQIRGQYDHATTGNAIALLAVRYPDIQAHAIEAAGAADEVVPELRKPRPDYEVTPEMAGRLGMTEEERLKVQALRRRGMSGLIYHPVTEGSKEVRARTFVVPVAEAGNVHIIEAGFTPTYLDEMAEFPGGTKDQVDATSQALQRLGVGTASITAPTRRAAPPTTAHQPSAPRAGVAPVSRLVAPSRRRR